MYATCLFCGSSLGTNEAIEAFSVGSRVAFDAAHGRLWAVCTRCGRWNLAPIEERWEAVEAAERLFTDTRARVHSENIGLCKLPDGTRLVRVGKALPGELAAWRYGSQLVSRRRRYMAIGAAGVAVSGAVIAGIPLLISAGITLPVANIALQAWAMRSSHVRLRRVVHRVPAERSPTGGELVVRRQHLHESVLTTTAAGDIGIRLPMAQLLHPWKVPAGNWKPADSAPLDIGGAEAHRILARSMTDYNSRGAKEKDIGEALSLIGEAGGPEAFARGLAASGAAITRTNPLAHGRRGTSDSPTLRQVLGTFRGEVIPVRPYKDPWNRDGRPKMGHLEALALEMALNEESERRALEGELLALEAAWREAEEIARIADALPGPPGSRPA